jgi:hypothetical protein
MSDLLIDGEPALPGGMPCEGTSMSCTPTVHYLKTNYPS